MKDTSQEQERVRQLIHEAFAGITLGRGVSLHETVVIDDYGSTQARQKAREKDEKKDWRKLVDAPELKAVTGIGGLSFFDAEGLRFHLPAYMCLALVSPLLQNRTLLRGLSENRCFLPCFSRSDGRTR